MYIISWHTGKNSLFQKGNSGQGITTHQRALQACQFWNWALNQLHQRFLKNNHTHQDTNGTNNAIKDNNTYNNIKKWNISLVVPYIQGISEKFKKLCKCKGIQVYFKGTNTLRTQLVTPKDKEPKLQKSGIIYHYKCPDINCTEAYIGETGRALGNRVNEHLKAPSPHLSLQQLYRTSLKLWLLQHSTQGNS